MTGGDGPADFRYRSAAGVPFSLLGRICPAAVAPFPRNLSIRRPGWWPRAVDNAPPSSRNSHMGGGNPAGGQRLWGFARYVWLKAWAVTSFSSPMQWWLATLARFVVGNSCLRSVSFGCIASSLATLAKGVLSAARGWEDGLA
ncbi:hypothetical protein Vretifemale_5920 [Volvox reticuliferus]|uniref:Uncharacterized protein n=1 Tax=Volvox reticuliferus TaxID=1737510 RepID=A0A8J4C645_9CHLO|nr:hypothetical protein Vretifemale_5920 [Volvox reticuliferus]